jgi:hypothetical protein
VRFAVSGFSLCSYISYFRDFLDMEQRRREQELFERTPVAGIIE